MIREDSDIMKRDPSSQDGYEGVSLLNYVHVLVAWWREIALGVVLFMAAGVGSVLALNIVLPKYETTADVAIIHRDAAVSIDQTFRAVSERSIRSRSKDLVSKRSALIGLVQHGGVAVEVLEQLSGLLDEDGYSVTDLLESVKAELVTIGVASRRNQSDLIRITVSADTPEKVVAIADAWAKEYVSTVNRLYEHVPQDLIVSVQNKLDEAEVTYEDSQKRLEVFLSENPSGLLERQIEALLQEIAPMQELIRTGSYSMQNKALLVQLGILNGYYDTRLRLIHLLDDVRSLRFEIMNGDDAGSVSSEIAIRLVKIQAYAMTTSLPETIRLHIDNIHQIHTNGAKQRIEIDRLLEALETRLAKLGKNIQSLSDELASAAYIDRNVGNNPFIHQLQQAILRKEDEIRALQTQKETSNSMLDEIIRERDLAKSTMTTLQNEVIELQLSSVAPSSQVRLVSPAVVPEDSAWPSPILAAAIGGASGSLIMLFFAFIANALGVSPYFKKNEERAEVSA